MLETVYSGKPWTRLMIAPLAPALRLGGAGEASPLSVRESSAFQGTGTTAQSQPGDAHAAGVEPLRASSKGMEVYNRERTSFLSENY